MTDDPQESPGGLVTRTHLAADLRALGLRSGAVVMVHTSLRALGWVVGGAQTVLEALRDAVGSDGTIVMPAQSWQLCEPAVLRQAPEASWQQIREALPLYDPAVTPSQTMGVVAELFRTVPGTLRSAHPHRSITASGPLAELIVARHPLGSPSGEESPLGRLFDVDAQILLLGVTAAKATMLHLAEHRADFPGKSTAANGVAMLVDGQRQWVTYDELDVDDEDFDDVFEAFRADTGLVTTGRVGEGVGQLAPARALVDYAADWFSAHRGG